MLFAPLELIERLAVLVPPPRFHVVRYDGLLAPRASWRDEVVPATCVTVGTGESRVNSGSVPAPVTHSAIAEASGDISAGTPIEGTNSDTLRPRAI